MAKFLFIKWLEEFLQTTHGFIWDHWNKDKIFQKHGITPDEVESCFKDLTLFPLGLQVDPISNEERFGLIAKDKSGRILFVSFTVRDNLIRPISCRFTNKKERNLYDS